MKKNARNKMFCKKGTLWILISIMFFMSLYSTASSKTQEKALSIQKSMKALKWRSLGPAHMSGRITDIAVARDDKYTIYCATATGGIWKTENNGTTWEPIFDHEGTGSIGDIAVAESHPNIIWAGTGEANASSYTSWGNGVYKSTDGGETWSYSGLGQTHHIGRVIIDPIDPNVVYVAALGHLWGSNPERGLFKTTDGGKTWEKNLYINENVGFVDIVLDPSDSNTLYAASYGRRSDRFDDFDSMGIHAIEGSGIYKTKDGGENWEKLSSGLPSNRVGRIGLATANSSPEVIYAIIERAPFQVVLEPSQLMKIDQILSSRQPNHSEVENIRELITNRTPQEEMSAAVVAGLSRRQQQQLRALLGQGGLDTGGGIFRSDNKGETWHRVNSLNERASYYSQIRIDPKDEDHVYALLVRTWESTDGGRSFSQKGWAFSSYLTSSYIHGDFHAMWIDPDDPGHLIVGSDGGLYTSYDGGNAWEAHPLPLGQFVSIALDMREPYYLYGGLQDNGVWGGPSETRHVSGISDADWFKIITGDGGYVQADPIDHTRIYAESQYGAISRVDLTTGKRISIHPSEKEAGQKLRFNYVAPFIISPHDSSTLYLGAHILLKSIDNGDKWKAISPDLTKNEPAPLTLEGATISSISESPLAPGTLYAGTDDGNLYLTKDDGRTWINLSNRIQGLPKDDLGRPNIWVSRVETSHFHSGRAYVSFDGHRDDDFSVYLYATENFGESWHSIAGNLPKDVPINVIREDVKNESLLFVGTETGVFCTLSRGSHWERLNNNFPTVPVDDLLIHPKNADLIAGTHGRGIYILDIWPLQQLSEEVAGSEVFLFDPEATILYHIDLAKNKGASGARRFIAQNPFSELAKVGDRSGAAPSGASIYYFLKNAAQNQVKITVFDRNGNLVRELKGPADKGINRVLWDLRENPLPLPPSWQRLGSNDSRRLEKSGPPMQPGRLVQPGLYRIRLLAEGITSEKELLIKKDRL
jgi:photosystem II stability/assembly factor-like uncharacterized protein